MRAAYAGILASNMAGTGTALRFDGNTGGTVNFGPFIAPGATISTFFIDMLVSPTDPDQAAWYMLSAGWGGAHVPALIGYESVGGFFGVTGNVWDEANSQTVSFATATRFKTGYLYQIIVLYDGAEIKVYVNGVIEAVTAFVSATLTLPAVVDTVLYFGGSNHDKASFDAQYLRIFIDALPGNPASYTPMALMSTWPKSTYWDGSAFVKASGMWDFTQDVQMFPDLSDGLSGVKHPGIRMSGSDNGNFLNSYPIVNLHPATADLPKIVNVNFTGPYIDPLPTIPPTAKFYDSFVTRDYSPFWTSADGLGSNEGGTAGIGPWTVSANMYGISSGRAFPKTTSGTEYAVTTDLGSLAQDIRVDVEGTKITIAGRWVDDNNFAYCQVYVGGGVLNWVAGKKIAGSFSSIASGSTPGVMPSNVRLQFNGTTGIQVDTDGVNRINTTDGSLPTGTKAAFNATTPDLAKVSLFEVY